jgi:hypothetical protein
MEKPGRIRGERRKEERERAALSGICHLCISTQYVRSTCAIYAMGLEKFVRVKDSKVNKEEYKLDSYYPSRPTKNMLLGRLSAISISVLASNPSPK